MEPVLRNAPLLAWSGYEPFLIAFVLGGLFVALTIIEDKRLRQRPLSRAAAAGAVLVSLAAGVVLAAIVCIEMSQ